MTCVSCDLYLNPYRTRCAGSISPDGEVSVCWRHLQASRDLWMDRAETAERELSVHKRQHELDAQAAEKDIAYWKQVVAEITHGLEAVGCDLRAEGRRYNNEVARADAAEARAEKAEGLVGEWLNEHGGSGPTISLLERSRAMVWSENPDSAQQTPRTYEVIGSLYEHECRFGCDSPYAVNCNCAGKCAKHEKLV